MNSAIHLALMFLSASTAVAAGASNTAGADEFRVASMLFTGAVAGTIIGIAISETETKRRLITRGLIALFAGPGLMTGIDYYSSWLDLAKFPYLLLAFFGIASSLTCFFVGFAFVKRLRNNEDTFAADAMDKTMGKAHQIKTGEEEGK